ncbi:UDP-N-acetylglucosamine 1-carboxyvinyltransferase [Alkalispirochaeta alkalica]|uniref:UDP-N-acetylglucosamine 1-carboxyvinyltransferase n=1 Tax=Alkalispirochaeta alkalica TaxID=46356 RepID=UPI000688BF89|nr:UDP-N-acetylglucosamine 1-carboxyvinyltransferase [Alkalispirochaeta alkalica]
MDGRRRRLALTNFGSCCPRLLKVNPSVLCGDVRTSGAKNSALRLLAASILTSEPVRLSNFPRGQSDCQLHLEMLQTLGKTCIYSDTDEVLEIAEPSGLGTALEWHERSIRNTLLMLGALVARFGEGSVPLPGGCQIGEKEGGRGYDLHVMLLERLGAKVWAEGDWLCAEAPNGLTGTDIHLPIRSTGATENSIIAGCLARGTTTVWNPHIRPEIQDLVKLLRGMGAKITVFGQERIVVEGVEALGSVEHTVIPDNVEALTWLVGAAITGGEVEIHDFPYDHLEVPLIHLRESGVRLFRGDTSLVVRGSNCYPLEISTGPYPGINSDMQPLLAVFGARANGESRYIDLRFPGRYGYAKELAKMGMMHRTDGNLLIIDGGKKLHGAEVRALDLRAGVALALAGMVADGETIIEDAWQISRGYDSFVEKATALGADVRWGK